MCIPLARWPGVKNKLGIEFKTLLKVFIHDFKEYYVSFHSFNEGHALSIGNILKIMIIFAY